MDKHGQFLSAVLVMMLALIMIAMFSVYAMILEGNGNVYTSLTSSSISSYMAEQIANQYSNIMPFSSSVNSTFSGMLKNFIEGYYPSYVLADSLLNYTNLTYDYAMPPNVTVPNSVEAYVSVILNNTQSSPTPAPFQQMINVPNTTSFWSYINTTSGYFGQNVEFFYGNGKIIPSWLESYNSSSGRWWIKTGSIAANSKLMIYIGFASKTTNLFNTNNVGEAPQLSSTYAEYDDGANVFNDYWNFAGTGLPSGFTAVSGTAGTDYKVNNGLQLLTTNVRIQSTASLSGNYILEVYHQFISDAANGWDFGVYSSSSAAFGIHPDGGGGSGTSWVDTYYYNNGYTQIASSGETIGSGYYFIWQIINNAGSITTNFDSPSYNVYYTASFTNTVSAPITIGERFDNGDTGQAMNDIIYWLRTRAYPPNGVMPSVSFGSVA